MDWAFLSLTAIGGVAGAGIGLLIGRVFRVQPDGRNFGMARVLALLLLVAGANLGPPYLEPYLGKPIRNVLAAQVDRAVEATLQQEPIFQVLQEYAPEQAMAWRTSIAAAYRRGGYAESVRASEAEGDRIGGWIITEFGPRASDESIVSLYENMVALTEETLIHHPRACYGFYFYDVAGGPQAPDLAELGADENDLVEPLLDMVRTASSGAIDFDQEVADAVQNQAYDSAVSVLGADRVDLLDGRLPVDEVEYRLARLAMLEFLSAYLDSEYAVTGLRGLLSYN
jgi:hypothetical protein